MVSLDVSHEIFEPAHEAFAFGLNCALQCLRVRAKEVRGREHIDDLAREVLHSLLLAWLEMLDILDRLPHSLGVQHVLLLEEVEIGVCVPERVLETAIKRRFVLWRLDFPLRERTLCLNVVFHRLRPKSDLMLEDLRGVGHHLGDVCGGCTHEELLARTLQRSRRRLFLFRNG